MKLRYLLPLGGFLVLAAFLLKGLSLDPKKVPSPLIGKPVPSFDLVTLQDPERHITNADLKGKVSLFNVWATWCVSCRAEHQVLMEIHRSDEVEIYGLDYKDERPAALRWLRSLGNPYAVNAFDANGRVGINWGVYGTPETFLIDQQGIIRYKHIGPISWEDWQNTLLPKVRALKSKRG